MKKIKIIVMALLLAGCSNYSSEKKKESVNNNDSKIQEKSSDVIDLQTAKQTALDHADVEENEAQIIEAKLDYDDGAEVYEIEFVANDKVYDYEIIAADGSIRKMSNEPVEEIKKQVQAQISLEEAKTKALENAGVDQSEAVFTKVKLKMDDGIPEYGIKFYAGDIVYICEIDGNDGTVLKMETERRDY